MGRYKSGIECLDGLIAESSRERREALTQFVRELPDNLERFIASLPELEILFRQVTDGSESAFLICLAAETVSFYGGVHGHGHEYPNIDWVGHSTSTMDTLLSDCGRNEVFAPVISHWQHRKSASAVDCSEDDHHGHRILGGEG